jgi:hypothetical protein
MLRHRVLLTTVAVVGSVLLHFNDFAAGHHPTASITVYPVNTGQTYVPSLRLLRTPISGRVQVLTVNRVAIFPLADYSHQQSFTTPLQWGSNRLVIETLTDRFIAHGITVAIQEDLEARLMAEGLMAPPQRLQPDTLTSPTELFAHRASVSNTPEYELVWGLHDQTMRNELSVVVQSQDYLRAHGLAFLPSREPIIQGLTTGLSKDKIIELGRVLDVDVILRGRILESGFKPSTPLTSVLQLRLYAQDARTGELFWSNRGELEVTHPDRFSSPAPDAKSLVDRATRELIDALMTDFFGER